ncbi:MULTISPECIES: type IV pilus biogenesis/stability protein PilW [Halomonas]|uniref:Type IV pilus biogenesis/stability protein PilW n=1 Tax=Halomonas flagellata TaxID=2920385 RepID=A0ABS9RZ27_9GAMM|nr:MULTISPECIES: type IV pilus biogenesis/stability protein PilW [Halomonas]MCH4565074.1 type IV pilus biogenesis/stability protein PilW [Halomonas flagellata]PXY00378.1 type IV pilus biogenesis/stability protein PilW [Halomonas sp. LBP4]
MTRCPRTPGLTQAPAVAVLLGALWLAGCASQVGPFNGNEDNPGDAYTRLGIAYLERGNLQRAMSSLDRALQMAPGDAEALQAMAMVYQRQGEDELADETFRRALDADSDFTRVRNNYAAFLYDRGRIREACDQLELASRDSQYANRAQLFANLGQCQRELGDLDAARASLARAQAIDPRSARSYFTLAELEHAQGNHARARNQLEGFMRLAGASPGALRLARDIARAEGDRAAAAFYTEQLDAADDAP